MATIKAQSTNTISFKVEQPGTTWPPDTLVLLVEKPNGDYIVGLSPQYIPSTGEYRVVMADSYFPSDFIGGYFTFVWRATWGTQSFTERETRVVVSDQLGESVAKFRLRLGDSGEFDFATFVGDGVTTTFPVEVKELVPGSTQVFVDQVLSTNYEVLTANPSVKLGVAPVAGSSVEIRFLYRRFTDQELAEFLSSAVGSLNGAFSLGIDPASPGVPDMFQPLFWRLATRELYTYEMLNEAGKAISFTDQEKSVSRTNVVASYKAAIDAMSAQIEKDQNRLLMSGVTGLVRSGGTEPNSYTTTDRGASGV